MATYVAYNAYTDNIGDLACDVRPYFPWLEGRPYVDPFAPGCEVGARDACLVTGGGFLMYDNPLRRLCKRAGQTILWGVGTNLLHQHRHASSVRRWYPRLVRRALLAGVRDLVPSQAYTPCPSCMSEAFDSPPPPTIPVVVYEHQDWGIFSRVVENAPLENNRANYRGDTVVDKVRSAVGFLASGETIVTNTYHGAVWGRLMGRRVILFQPWSTKFWYMFPEIEVAYTDAMLESMLGAQVDQGEARLGECRDLTRAFAARALRALLSGAAR